MFALGPLLRAPHFTIGMLKWCGTHVLHLGTDLFIIGNALRVLLDDFGEWRDANDSDDCDDRRLYRGYQAFKTWCRQNKWETFGQICRLSKVEMFVGFKSWQKWLYM